METAKQQSPAQAIKSYFSGGAVQEKFKEILGNKAAGFITSVLQIVHSSKDLSACSPESVYQAAAIAATLDLPINNNLGYACIVAYNERQPDGTYTKVAQFQMMYKGFIQLGQRSGQFSTINATDVREGEIKTHDRMTGDIQFEWITEEAERLKKPIIGYVSYFRLVNGFEKSFYMSIDKLKDHGKKYSKTYTNVNGRWNKDLEAMCIKTVLKLNLSKYAPMSIQMQTAIQADQAKIIDMENSEFEYVDNIPDSEILDREELIKLYEEKMDKLSSDELQNAQRIINNIEENSYSKLFNLLKDK